MPRQVVIKALRLVDLDDLGAAPTLKLTQATSGMVVSSAGVATKNRKGALEFLESSGLCSFVASEDSTTFTVNVVVKDPKTNFSTIYPGVGSLTLTGLLSAKVTGMPSVEQRCNLFEEDLPYGELFYTYEVQEVKSGAAAAATPAVATITPAAATTSAATTPAATKPAAAATTTPAAATTAAAKVAPSSSSSAAAAVKEIDDVGDDEIGAGGDAAVKSGVVRKRRKKKSSVPSWVASCEPSAHPEKIARDIQAVSDQLSKITIRVHCVMVVVPAGIPMGLANTATAKITLLPLPNKPTTLRSRALPEEPTPTSLFFDFEKKSALLSLSPAELRSRLFREGDCPRVQLDVSAVGHSFNASMYLPSLLMHGSGDLLSVPLVLSEASDKAIFASAVIEVNPSPLAESSTPSSSEQLTTAQLRAVYEGAKNRQKKLGSLKLSVYLEGVANYSPESSALSGHRIEGRLCSSGGKVSVFPPIESSSFFGSGFSVCTSIALVSSWPLVDLLEIKLFKGNFPEDEVGRLTFPLSLITESMALAAPPGDSNCLKLFATSSFDDSSSSLKTTEFSFGCRFDGTAFVSPETLAAPVVAPLVGAPALIVPNAADSPVAAAAGGGGGGGWTATSTPLVSVTAKVQPTKVQSVSGTLIGCVQGFITRSGRPFSFDRNDQLTMETTLFPEGLKKSTSAVKPLRRQIGDDSAVDTLEWSQGKSFTIPLAWALQQRQVSYLKINMSRTAGGASKASQIGGLNLDLAPLASSGFFTVLCLVPVKDFTASSSSSSSHVMGITQDHDVCGWLLVGLQLSLSRAMTADLLEAACANIWNSITASAFKLSSLALYSISAPSNVTPVTAQTTGVITTTLMVDLTQPEFPAATVNSVLAAGESLVLMLRYDCDPSASVSIATVVVNNQLQWEVPQATLRAMYCKDQTALSSFMFVYLLRGNTAQAGPLRVMAESSFVLPREVLQFGVPLDLSLPLRDSSGSRVAILNLCLHATSLGGIEPPIAVGEVGPETNDAHAAPTPAPVELFISFDEGNVKDPSWRSPLEPFFECSLIPPPNLAQNKSVSSCKLQDRSGFLSSKIITDDSTKWCLGCKLTIPTDCLPVNISDEASAVKWILAIVCRDSARRGCPELGWARVSIPFSLPLRGQSIDQWINFSPPAQSRVSGRVHVRIERVGGGSVVALESAPQAAGGESSVVPNSCTSNSNKLLLPSVVPDAPSSGLGTVLFWLKNILESRSGQDDTLVSLATASVSTYIAAVASRVASSLSGPIVHDIDQPMIRFSEVNVANTNISSLNTPLFSSIPVPAGNCEVRIKVVSQNTRSPYVASFNVMSTTTAGVNKLSQAPTIPSHSLVLTDDLDAVPAAAAAPSARAQRRMQQLKFDAAFVPYVQGNLIVKFVDIKMRDGVPAKFTGAEARRGAIRAVIGPTSYAYSDSFDLVTLSAALAASQTTSNNGTKSTLPKAPLPTAPTNLLVLPVDTLEAAALGINNMLTLNLNLIDLDAAAESGSQYNIGVGYLQTASLYYQAVRAAACSALPTMSSQLLPTASTSDEVGSSPWLQTDVDILDPATNKSMAIASVLIQFVMTSVPEQVVRAMTDSLDQGTSNAMAKSKIELGLKQSFKSADVDNSGNISGEELLGVITKARAKREAAALARSMYATNATQAPVSAVTITSASPTEDAVIGMLMSLAGVDPSSSLNLTDKELAVVVTKIFARLDVDGAGNVSWWEWKRVLLSNLLGRNAASKYLDPKDVLQVGLIAAYDAVSAAHPRRPDAPVAQTTLSKPAGAGDTTLHVPQSNGFKTGMRVQIGTGELMDNCICIGFGSILLDRPLTNSYPSGTSILAFEDKTADLQFVRVSLKPASSSSSGGELETTIMDEIPDDLPPAKAVPRLQNMVKSLRANNSSLTKRLEKAISDSQQILGFPSPMGGGDEALPPSEGGSALGPSEAEALKVEVFRAKQRVQDAEKQQQSLRMSLDMEKQRAVQLEEELSKLKRLNAVSAITIAGKDSAGQQVKQKLEMEISKHNENLKLAASKRKLRMRAMVLLAMFFRKRVLPWLRAKIAKTKSDKLAHALGGAVARKKYLETKKQRTQAATALQGGARGMFERRKVVKMHKGATKIQAIFRGKRARDLRSRMLLEKAASAFSAKYRAASIVKRALLRWMIAQQKKKDEAAARIQSIQRARLAKRKVENIKTQSHLEKERELKLQAERELAAQKLEASQREIREQERLALEKVQKSFQENKTSAVPVGMPHLKATVGYWIRLASKHGGSGADKGLITDFDKERRVLQVLFNDGKGNPDEKKEIPYDHPKIEWFAQPDMPVSAVAGPHSPDSPARSGMSPKHAALLSTSQKLFSPLSSLPINNFPSGVLSDDESTVVDIEETERPPIADADKGYLISYSVDGTLDNERSGQVHGVEVNKRLILVSFSDQQTDPESPRVEYIPYDHPHLSWFKDENYINKIKAKANRRTVLAIQTSTRPPIRKTVGYTVEILSKEPDAEPGDFYVGKVVSFNEKEQTITIGFDTHENASAPDHEMLPYLSKDIAWMTPPAPAVISDLSIVPRPKDIKKAVGYSIGVASNEQDADDGDLYLGKVVFVDEKEQTILIKLANGSKDAEATGIEDTLKFPFESEDVAWMKKPDLPSASTLSAVPRPKLRDAIGYTVEVRSTEPNAEEEDFYSGKVASIDVKKNRFSVLFEAEEGEEQDKESYPYDTKEVAWMAEPPCPKEPGPCSKISTIQRPPLAEAVGYQVEVQSYEEGAAEGDTHPGTVVAINAKITARPFYFGSITVNFEVEDGEPEDKEELPYDSHDVAWMAPPQQKKVPAPNSQPAAAVASAPAPASSPAKAPKKFIRPQITEALGWRIELVNDDDPTDPDMGHVVQVNAKSNMLTVLFVPDAGAAEGDIEEIPYKSRELKWISPPGENERFSAVRKTPVWDAANSKVFVPRPPLLKDTKGLLLKFIHGKLEHHTATIVDVDEARNMLLVRFFDANGHLDEEIEQVTGKYHGIALFRP